MCMPEIQPAHCSPSQQARRRLAFTVLSVMVLAGCTIVQPVPPSVGGAGAGGMMSWSRPAPGDATPECIDRDQFVGGLGEAMCELDAQRIALVRLSADAINEVATYNALLWPLGAGMLYEPLRGAPSSNLLLPAVLMAGAYGFINSGIPGRQQAYLTAAGSLGCAILGASVDLVRKPKSPGPADVATADVVGDATRVLALREQTGVFEKERIKLLSGLRPRASVAGRPAASWADSVTRKHASTGGGAVSGSDTRAQVASLTLAQLDTAHATIGQGTALQRRIDGAAMRLRAQRSRIEGVLQDTLASKAPPPADPVSVANSLFANANKLLNLQSTAVPPAAPRDAALPPSVFDGLDKDSRARVEAFQKDHAAPLRSAERAVQEGVDGHAARLRTLVPLLEEAGCAATAVAVAAPANSTRPPTGVTSGSGSSTGGAAGGASVPSGTPLSP